MREKQLTEGESWREEIQLNHEIQYDGNKGNKKKYQVWKQLLKITLEITLFCKGFFRKLTKGEVISKNKKQDRVPSMY